MSTSASSAVQQSEDQILIEDARDRAGRALRRRELVVEIASAASFAVAAGAMVLVLPEEAAPGPWTAVMLVVLYALARLVSFEVGTGYTSPVVLALVPMLFLLPAPAVPLYVAAGIIVADLVDAGRGRRHPARALLSFGQAWHAIGPALVFSAAAVGPPEPADWPVYAAALGALFLVDGVASLFVDRFGLGVPIGVLAPSIAWIYAVDAMLAPIGFLAAYLAWEDPAGALLVAPLIGLLAIFARERTARLDNAVELGRAYRGTALLLGDLVEFDHEYTGSHSREVVDLALTVGARLGLSPAQLRDLEFGSLLHDVGKIAVPKAIINKPGPLDDAEWAIMKHHTIEGQRMLESVGGALARVGRIVRASHEHVDGSGYPDGLVGEAIPIEARICTTCDAYSAMTTDRSYRAGMSSEAALAELRRCSGTQFDPAVVAVVEALLGAAPGAPLALAA